MSGTEAERRAAPPPPDVSAWMRADWDARARENARFYINTVEHDGLDFALSGCRDAFEVVGPLHRELRPDMSVLEIGCGIGRMLQFLAVMFAEAHGIDVAPTMVAKATEQLRHVPRATVHLGDGRTLAGLRDASFDLVLSFQVFQHVPQREVVDDYVREAFRVLRPRGLFRFLVKTEPWAGQGARPDTWCGVDLGRADADRWLAAAPWTLRSFEPSADRTKSWVLLQKP
jgi:SAM-dependent methyltransferase